MIRATGAYTKAVVAWSWKANECELLLETDTGPMSVLAPLPPFASPAQAYDVEYDATPCGLVVRRWHAMGWDEARLLQVLRATPNKDVVELWKALGMKGKPQPAVLVDIGKSRDVSVLDHGLKMRGALDGLALRRPAVLAQYEAFGRHHPRVNWKPHRVLFPEADMPGTFERSPDPDLRASATASAQWRTVRLVTAVHRDLPDDYVGKNPLYPPVARAQVRRGARGALTPVALTPVLDNQPGPEVHQRPGNDDVVYWFAPSIAACTTAPGPVNAWAFSETEGVVYKCAARAHRVLQIPVSEGGCALFPDGAMKVGIYAPGGSAECWTPALICEVTSLVKPGGQVFTNIPQLCM